MPHPHAPRCSAPHSLFATLLLPLLPACTAGPERPAATPAGAGAAHEPLSLAVVYDPEKRVDFSGKPPSGLVWLDDAHYLWPRTDPVTKKLEWLRVDAVTGKTAPFADAAQAARALAQLPGVSAERAAKLAFQDAGALNKTRTAVLLDVAKDLWSYTFGSDAAVRLTNTPEVAEENAIYSPDGRHVSFVRGNDLYVVDLDPVAERRLTTDGSATVLNGKLDWLYQEEVYGRGNYNSHWWSPDSTRVAFLRLDEQGVPAYTLVDDVSEPIRVETSPYPRAGETNPLVQLGVARSDGSGTTWVDLSAWKASEPLVVDVGWTPATAAAASELTFSVQDREQTWLELHRVAATGAPQKLLRETTRAWVDNHGSPTWLEDGTFLWFSERDGWKHLYRFRADGTLAGQVTRGAFEVRTLHGVDEVNGWIYFSGTERSHIGGDVYRIRLDGGGLERLTQAPGTHTASFSPSFARFLDTWSDASTPAQVRLHAANGAEERVLDANPVPALAQYGFITPEFVKVPARDGFVMDAMLVKPAGFDPQRRYPVFQWTYAGPHSPQVANRWGRDMMFFQLLAQRGIAVWICDNRTASGQGAVSAWPCYQNLGESELADIEDGVAWLKRQSWVDGERIGIGGWSYGGFMTGYALTHSRSFCMGIAGGSVTSWKEYDSIYTERYMKTPKSNPKGYERSSVQGAAKDLHGALLLIHGQIDDNVHPGNTLRLAYALQKANKRFELMLYPHSRHGIGAAALVLHWRTMMVEFIEEQLVRKAQS